MRPFVYDEDLHEFVNILKIEILWITNINHGSTTSISMEEVQSLYQKVVQLRETSQLASQPNSRDPTSTSSRDARISMPKKFDGTRAKF